MRAVWIRSVLYVVVSLALTCVADPSSALVFTVNSTADQVDAVPGNGVCATAGGTCTLRAAIQESNVLAGDHQIILPAGTYTLSITGTNEEDAATGDLDINKAVGLITITGDGERYTTINGGGIDRVIDVVTGLADITGVTITNGDFTDGGGVANAGLLTVTDATITGNTATSEGGGVDNRGDLTLTRVTITNNTGQLGGGGLSNNLQGIAFLDSVIINNNTAGGDGGGGITNNGDVTITEGTLSGNSGRAIDNNDTATLTLENVTISGNTANAAAGISNGGIMALRNVTIAANTAAVAPGGIRNTVGATASLVSTIIASNVPSNCVVDAALTSLGHNIDSANTCGLAGTADLINTNPTLGPLQDNGGYALTQALLTGSPAIDSGDPVTCSLFDARLFPRPLDGNGTGVPAAVCDIGAYELCRAVFTDVTPGSTFDVYIQSLSCNLITTGCNPPANNQYCPTNNVTRQAMAAFIIRALFGENFLFTQAPYFTDVPATNQFFKYIQKMRDEGITTGCNLAGTLYCPTGTVTRQAMSAFIIRALFGENFFFTPTPFFTDVPATNQFFKYVQRMRDEGITTGCNPPANTQYCPADNVTRQAMAAFIGRGFLSIP